GLLSIPWFGPLAQRLLESASASKKGNSKNLDRSSTKTRIPGTSTSSRTNENCHRSTAWRVMQPLLRSSYMQFGVCSLETDVEDVEELLAEILVDLQDSATVQHSNGTVLPKNEIKKHRELVFVGHSTGCQIAVRWLLHRANSNSLASLLPFTRIRLILQGAVSDREATEQEMRDAGLEKTLCELQALLFDERHGEDRMADGLLLPARLAPFLSGAPAITIGRARSFLGRLTADDLFSTDLTADEIAEIFSPVRKALVLPSSHVAASNDSPSASLQVNLQLLLSPKDEYAILKSKEGYADFLSRYCIAATGGGAKFEGSYVCADRRFRASYSLYEGSHGGAEVSDVLSAAVFGSIANPLQDTSMLAEALHFMRDQIG
ncbi:unnamed protein product, partial [Amoebophrya sp. A25]